MTLSVIGAGFGRTGTSSLKLALERLGFGPCYHMKEIIADPARAEAWARAADGEPVDWDDVFAGYRSAVDWPAADYWRQLMAQAPDAKIVLTVRDPERWFASTQATIFGPDIRRIQDSPTATGRMMRALADRNFGGAINDRAACLAGLARHAAEVRSGVPADRLLVYDVGDGWAPLCAFLGVAVPGEPFPRANTTQDFQSRVASLSSNHA